MRYLGIPLLALGLFALDWSSASAQSIVVTNPSFEADGGSFDGAPGYISSNANHPITGWTATEPTRIGVNSQGQPFASGVQPPDAGHVGFIQSAAGTGTLSQTLSGLDTTKQYWFQAFYDARTGPAAQLNVTYGAQTLVNTGDVPNSNAYTFVNVPFTPSAASAALRFSNPQAAGDTTILFDGISVIQRDANQVVIANPSFEGSGFPGGVGYTNAIAGWTTAGGTGINTTSGPEHAFGFVSGSEGTNYALLQAGAAPTTLSQTLPGLVDGQMYTLSLLTAGRAGLSTPTLSITLGSHVLLTTQPLATDNVLTPMSFTLTANAADGLNPVLTFASARINPGDDATLFLDNVSLVALPVPEPGTLAMLTVGSAALVIGARRRRTAG